MLTRNTTPFLFGTKASSRQPPQPEMTLIAKGVFALRPDQPLTPLQGIDRGHLSGDVFADGDDERRGECHYGSDFADFKLNAEVLLRGTCHAPQGRPVSECPARFTVGAWSKSLRVVGQRVWKQHGLGQSISDPAPFTKMPLSYTSAFGGPESPANPVGTGWKTDRLPTIEHPAQPIRSRNDRPAPAGFGPINPAWPLRAAKVGKAYGKTYRDKRAPYYAEDFDYAYFSAAPADQQWKGYLRGDEEIALHNLHPSAPVLSARLPGVRVRAFVNDDAGRFREVAMSLDTLFVDADKGLLVLVWRGVDQVRESDLIDVKTVLLVAEPLAKTPVPAATHRERLEAFERDPVGLAELKEPPPADCEERDPVLAYLAKELGGIGAAELEALRPAMKEALAKLPPGVDVQAKLAELMADAEETPPTPSVRKPGAMPSLGLRKLMREMMSQVAELKSRCQGKEIPPDAAARIAEMEQLPHDPQLSALDPDYTPPEPLSTEEPGPGANLCDRDFTEQDLSGFDLAGANLEGAILVRTKLAGVRLAGASLKGAVLFQADLTRADLTKADLTRVNAAKVIAEGADFTGAVIEQAFFEDANLREAILSEAKGEYPVFARADVTRAVVRGATLFHADFAESRLGETDFTDTVLVGSVFGKCHGAKVNMSGAKLTATSFEDADLTSALLVDASGERVSFIRAMLDGADFRWASLKESHFTEASAKKARFFGTNLHGCRFYRASLEEAELVQCNLLAADLCKARLLRTRFVGSCLYEAKLLDVALSGSDFTGANLERSTLENA